MKLDKVSIYYLQDVWSEIKLCYIKSNRKVDSQIEDKLKTCKAVGMQSPALFSSPKLAANAGYTLVDVNTGKDIPAGDIGRYDAVILEGNTRFWAWYNNREMKEDGTFDEAFGYKFLFVEFDSADSFKQAYHEINLHSVKTSNSDFARDIVATGGGNKVLENYKRKIDNGLVAKAAGYATYLREFRTEDVVKLQKGDAPDYMKDDKILQYTDRVYKAVLHTFGCDKAKSKMHKALKGSFVWKWNADLLKDVETDNGKLEYVTKSLETMYSKLPATVMFAITDAKASEGKTKEQVVRDLLQGVYDSQKNISE